MSAGENSRVVVIFGAAGGIGSELARQLAKDGVPAILTMSQREAGGVEC